jgi:hypothetical protein
VLGLNIPTRVLQAPCTGDQGSIFIILWNENCYGDARIACITTQNISTIWSDLGRSSLRLLNSKVSDQ